MLPAAVALPMPRLRPDDTLLLLVDMQEKLQPFIAGDADLRRKAAALAEGCRLLDVPLVVTEQYPKGLGRTVPELQGAVKAAGGALEKTAFSCPADAAVRARLESLHRKNVLLAGVEAHICVLQTAMDLAESGWRVHVVEDAVGARAPENRRAGLERAMRRGAEPSTVEMALFELMGDAKHPRFRDVQALIK
jgi:nicotinamidase-related amidase